MKILKKAFASPYMLLAFLLLKVIVYYALIDVNIIVHPLLFFTVGVYWLIFVGLSELEKKAAFWWFVIIYSFFSVIMFADSMYFNYYNQTVSIQQVYQMSNVAKVPSSFVATLIPASFFLLWDIPVALHYFNIRREQLRQGEAKRRARKIAYTLNIGAVVMILLLAINPIESKAVTRINTVGYYSSHIRDILKVSYHAVHEDLWDPSQVLSVVEDVAEVTPAATEISDEKKQLAGIAKGKNVIVIQLEAFQNFLLNAEYNGQELTPCLNELLKKDTIYFDNYYSVIGKGNTADAEFATLNSLYPVIDGESYRLYTTNTYNGLPWQLKDQGYTTYGFHGNDGSFWNREVAYPYQGIDNFYNMENLEASDIIGLGISDKSVFKQMVDVLAKEQGKFFCFGVSMTSHHPYDIGEELSELEILPEDEGSKFANYLQSVHYTDEAIGQLIKDLKAKGIYEDTVIAFYGDHHGLNATMDDNDIYVSRFLGKPYGYEEMMKVPCLIHIPGSEVTETISTLGCQVDFLPTMAYLMDFRIEQPYVMGSNLVLAKHGFAAFTAYLFEGSFAYDNVMFQISREGIFEGSSAWDRNTLEEIAIDGYEEQYNKAIELKEASKQVMEQDLIAAYAKHKVVPFEGKVDKEEKGYDIDK